MESQPGKGTAFRVDLPLAPVEERRTTNPDGVPSTASTSLRILVVDDEAAIRRVTVRFLERRGHYVDSVHDGGEALQRLATEEYDVIVSDLRMAGIGGGELFDRLREEGRGREKKLVFITGDAASGRAARLGSESAVPVLLKPVKLEELARIAEGIGSGVRPDR